MTTMADSRQLASGHPSVVASAAGLLAEFNQAGILEPLDVLSASAIARIWNEPDEAVALAAALTVRGTRFGHVCVRISNLREAVVVDGLDPEAMAGLPWPDPDDWEERLAGCVLTGDGTGNEPLVMVGDRLYLERYFRYEEQVAAMILHRVGLGTFPVGEAAGDALSRVLPLVPDGGSRQQEAARLVLGAKLAVIAGGPGTGKTHTIAALLAALAADLSTDFPRVALCAPTGKAAARLEEAVADFARQVNDPAVGETLAGVEASTIHRLLGWGRGRGRFAHDARHRLPHDLVVADEMSMVSLPLAAKLLAAVRPDATVVLVGDPFQLESIEAGTVLADIVGTAAPETSKPAMREHVVVLDRAYRFTNRSVMAQFADAVRTGSSQPAVELLGEDRDELRWVTDPDSPEFAQLWSTVVAQRARMVELASIPDRQEAALEALSGVAVLCARREGPDGVTRWRRNIEAALDERFVGLRYGGEWYPGRPVMITRNDYNLGLFNGDIGVAVETDAGRQVLFDRGGIRMFPLSYLGEHTTAHAMTIHKSQGSQFREVVVVLPGEASRLLTRELLYTAVTRASQRVWVVGGESVIRAAIGRSVQRASGLGSRLWGADQPGNPPESRLGKKE